MVIRLEFFDRKPCKEEATSKTEDNIKIELAEIKCENVGFITVSVEAPAACCLRVAQKIGKFSPFSFIFRLQNIFKNFIK
jgi:hypothetical protein